MFDITFGMALDGARRKIRGILNYGTVLSGMVTAFCMLEISVMGR